jgi:dihydroorotate dehydrogenase
MSVVYNALRPFLMRMDPERAHDLALTALRYGAVPKYRLQDAILRQTVCGLDFDNPLGLAAGFDKNGHAVQGLFGIGFGAVEVGTVTRRPQAGNPKPRVFRDPASASVINRMGFPGEGLEKVTQRLRSQHFSGVLGMNIGINKDTKTPLEDYVACRDAVLPFADYITVNISSPNTAGLRDWQAGDALDRLLSALMPCAKPLFVKVSPDMTSGQRADLLDVAIRHRINGLIVSNTTITRPTHLLESFRAETGGLSGPCVAPLALDALRDYASRAEGKMTFVSVGGIATAEDALERIVAGASLLQVYTALVYHGPGLVARILEGLAAILRARGFSSLGDAVGTGVNPAKKVI